MMYTTLVVIGGIIGIFVVGAAFYTIWLIAEAYKRRGHFNEEHRVTEHDGFFRRWTVMDYAALVVFALGAMLMVADLLAIYRDRESYPYYHYGYLFSAFIFMVVGMLFIVVRLGFVLRTPRRNSDDLNSSLPLDGQSSLDHNHD